MSSDPEWTALTVFSRIAVSLLSSALIFGTAVPLLRSDAWWIRVFDFPRIQIAALMVLTLAGDAALHHFGHMQPWEYALAAMVGLALIWQLLSIAPYTTWYPHEMLKSRAANDDSHRISLLIYNVLSGNRNVTALRNLIRDNNPDIIFLTEPNQWWLDHLDGLEVDYPHTLFQPQENDYGMLLYSRLWLDTPEIRFLIEPAIPSIRTRVRLRSGAFVTLYGVHPRPPGIKRDGDEHAGGTEKPRREANDEGPREDSDMRDAELMLVAKDVKHLGDSPVIVAGDFNDVAWSHTTHLFQRIGGLLDPRVGRGIFNTFDTRSRILRYPLDHAFASRHFLLIELRRLPDIGSDHFPLFVAFDVDPGASVTQEEPQPSPGDVQEADEAIATGKALGSEHSTDA